MKLSRPVAALIAALPLFTAAAQTPLQDAFKGLSDQERSYFQHVTTLSNAFFEGRAPGLKGNQLAADYVEFNLRKLNFTPAFPSTPATENTAANPFSSFRQPFSTGKETVAKQQGLSYRVGDKTVTLTPDTDFAVRGISGDGHVALPVVFVGYGISEGKDGYNSFNGMKEGEDLSGKVALLFRFEPLNDKGTSRWSDNGEFSTKSTLAGKLKSLASRKAAAVLLVSPPGVEDPRAKTIEDTRSSTQGTAQSVPIINLHVDAASRMVAAAGADLVTMRKAADERGGVADLQGLTVAIDADVSREANATNNVGAVLAGRGSLKDQFIVIGAHYDHVGYGYFGSRAGNKGTGKLHPGADDNASGTAGLLTVAAQLAADYAKLPADAEARSVMFVAFSGEEGGLIGSRFFVKNSPVEASRVYAMLNMDMIGRARHDSKGQPKCEVSGVDSAKGFMDILKPLFDDSGVAVKTLPGGQGPSDHASFYRGNIPVLHFFTGLHDQYHMPTDTYNYIEPVGAVKICELVRTVANTLSPRKDALEFQQAKGPSIDMNDPTEDTRSTDAAEPKPSAAKPSDEPATTSRRARTPEQPDPKESATPASAAGSGPGRGGSRVRFGIQPGDYDGGNGVEVGDVFPNTSAAEAGLKAGDVITKWNDTPLTSVQDWMPQLLRASPGDKVTLTVKRGAETLTLTATLKAAGN